MEHSDSEYKLNSEMLLQIASGKHKQEMYV